MPRLVNEGKVLTKVPLWILKYLKRNERRILRDYARLFEGKSFPPAPSLKKVLRTVGGLEGYILDDKKEEYQDQLKQKLEPLYIHKYGYRLPGRIICEGHEIKLKPILEDVLEAIQEVNQNYIDSAVRVEYEQQLREALIASK